MQRSHAAQVLGEMGPKADAAVPALLQALKNSEPRVRHEAARALKRIGPGPDAIPALVDALGDSRKRVVREAALALGTMGPQAKPAGPVLVNVLKGNVSPERELNSWFCEPVAEALGKIGPSVISALLEALAAEETRARGEFVPWCPLRPWAAHAIRRMDSGGAVPVLIEALNDASLAKREEAARLLGEVGPEARKAVPALRKVLQAEGAENADLRWAATEALRRIDSDTAKLVNQVRSLFDKLVLREEVLVTLQTDPTLSAVDRDLTLQIAQAYRQYPNSLNEAAWNTAKAREAGQEAYALAKRQAEAAVLLAPGDGNILNTLGVAQYRIGQYAEAVTTLSQSDKINTVRYQGSIPSDLAFLAMAQHRLGQKEQAAATAVRLREVMKQGRWAKDDEAQAFLRETEAVVQDKR